MEEKEIRNLALKNAIKFNGKANPGAVIGSIISANPEIKKNIKEVSKQINDIIKEINSMSVEDQLKELKKNAPELLNEKKEKKERNIFAFLGFKDDEKVNAAFPPGPEKYPHIGHAKACLLNYLLAKKYNGKFVLRFEDTNPKTAKQEFYKVMEDGFKWLGIEWDELVYASDHMEMFYEKAEFLMKEGFAYVDKSSQEEVKLSREKGNPTKYRDNSPEENLRLWEEMKKAKEGASILRLKIDLEHKNTTMRDPTMFRIIDEPHPRTKKKYRIWPNYDFQNSIMDSFSDIDMRLRSKEFELRAELQRWIQEKSGIKITKTYEFGRFNMTGVLSSGRVFSEKIEKKELVGWDDPSLTTLVALKRRGFFPEAIKNFVISTGISKAEATMTWDDLIIQNKRLLDNISNRFSFISDPINISVDGISKMDVELHLNPNEKKGGRKFEVDGSFILSKKDAEDTKEGELIRLMDCCNLIKKGKNFEQDSIEYNDFKGKGKKIINWLPAKENIDVDILMPDKKVVKGIAEHTIKNLKQGDVIQFERFGFCKLDKIINNKYYFWFTHK